MAWDGGNPAHFWSRSWCLRILYLLNNQRVNRHLMISLYICWFFFNRCGPYCSFSPCCPCWRYYRACYWCYWWLWPMVSTYLASKQGCYEANTIMILVHDGWAFGKQQTYIRQWRICIQHMSSANVPLSFTNCLLIYVFILALSLFVCICVGPTLLYASLWPRLLLIPWLFQNIYIQIMEYFLVYVVCK